MIYIMKFVEICKWRFRQLVHKTHEIDKFKKYPILRLKNTLNLDNQQLYKISEVL